MKRDPKEQYIKKKMKSITFKKIHPRFFYHKCNKCGFEYKKELMYKCSLNDRVLENVTYTYYGCTHCFSSLIQFTKYLQDSGMIYTEKSLKDTYYRKYI